MTLAISCDVDVSDFHLRAKRHAVRNFITLPRGVGVELTKALVDPFLRSNVDGDQSTVKVEAIHAHERPQAAPAAGTR